MDLRVYLETLREVRMMMHDVSPSRGARGCAATQRGDKDLHRPRKRPYRRFGGVNTSNGARNGRDRRD